MSALLDISITRLGQPTCFLYFFDACSVSYAAISVEINFFSFILMGGECT